MTPTVPQLEFVFTVEANVGAPLDLGVVREGRRRIIPILGGRFEGPALRGRLLPGGADWQIVRSDSSAELDARYTLETERGALIYVSNRGIRRGSPEILRKLNAGETVDPAAYYFRSMPAFETSASDCAWLMDHIFVASGERYSDRVRLHFWKLT